MTDAPIILGVAPQIHPDVPRETPLELWERLVYGRPERGAEFKALLRAVEAGMAWSLGGSRGSVPPGEPSPFPRPPADPGSKAGGQFLNCDSTTAVKIIFAPWHTADAWETSGPPPWLVVRVQHELASAGLPACEGGILLAGGAWRRFSMRADPGRQRVIADAVAAFARAVETRTPPAVTDQADLAVIRRLFPGEGEGRIDLPESCGLMWERAKRLRASVLTQARERDVIEAKIRQALMGYAEGRLPGGRRLALRTVRAPGGRTGTRLVEVH